MKKAQITTIDLFAAIAVFIILTAFLVYFSSSSTLKLEKQLEYEDMELKALRIADQLVKTPGVPSAWEETSVPISDIVSLGLAREDHILSRQKLVNVSTSTPTAKFYNNPPTKNGYEDLKEILKIKGYDFNYTIRIRDDILRILINNDIRIAYVAVGSAFSQGELQTAFIGTFNCKDVATISDRNTDRCELYRSNDDVNNQLCDTTTCVSPGANSKLFFGRLDTNEYDVVVLEDPSNTFNNREKMSHFDRFVKNNSGILIITAKLWVNSQCEPPAGAECNFYNISFTDRQNVGGNDRDIEATDAYYDAVDSGLEKFILNLPGDKNNHYVEVDPGRFGFVKPRTGLNIIMKNYLEVMNYQYNDPAYSGIETGLARWDYGPGKVYYITEVRSTTIAETMSLVAKGEVLAAAKKLFSVVATGGKPIPNKTTVVTARRNIIYEGQHGTLEFSLWK